MTQFHDVPLLAVPVVGSIFNPVSGFSHFGQVANMGGSYA